MFCGHADGPRFNADCASLLNRFINSNLYPSRVNKYSFGLAAWLVGLDVSPTDQIKLQNVPVETPKFQVNW